MTGAPPVVTEAEWSAARARLLVEEKTLTWALDAVAARRRRLPMVAVSSGYVFEGDHGPATLLELFADRRQLIVYHLMSRGVEPAGFRHLLDLTPYGRQLVLSYDLLVRDTVIGRWLNGRRRPRAIRQRPMASSI